MAHDSLQITISKRALLAVLCSLVINLIMFVVFDVITKEEVRSLAVRLQTDRDDRDRAEEEKMLKKLEEESFKITELTLKKGDSLKDVKRKKAPVVTKRKDKLSLSELAPQTTPENLPTPVPTPKKDLRPTDIGQIESAPKKLREQEALTKRQILNEFAANPEVAKVLNTKGFNMEFGLPEGLNETDLNSKELIYFAFLKRNFLKYLTTFLSTHNRLVVSRPALETALRSGPHLLNARAIYDEKGHMISFKILKSSLSNDIHHLFEETIQGMRTIPNPPKDFVKGVDKEFSVYYQLQINAH